MKKKKSASKKTKSNAGNVYWSKDIILLVTDKGMAGTQSWVDAYHGTGQPNYSFLVMPRSGAIQAVVNLDFPGTQDYESLGIFFGKVKKKEERNNRKKKERSY